MTPTTPAAQTGRLGLRNRLRRAAASAHLREIVAFLAVGGSSALLYLALNVVLTAAGMRPSLSILCTLALLVPPTYLAQRRVTFRSDRRHVAAFPRYLGTQLAGNGVALIGAELFPSVFRAHPLISFTALTVLVAAMNYGILKFWAFGRKA